MKYWASESNIRKARRERMETYIFLFKEAEGWFSYLDLIKKDTDI